MPCPASLTISRPARRRRLARGIALIEYALAMPLLLLMLAAGLDYGRSLRVAAEVSAAARAGAAFASTSAANSLNTAGIQAAAINSVPDVSGMTVSSVRSCKCPGGGAVLCSGSCVGNMLVYVQVNARAASTNIFSYPGLGFSGWTAAQVSMRVQ